MVVRIRMGFLGLCGLVVVSGKMCDANRRLQYAGRFRVVLSLVAAEGSVAVVSADTIVGVTHSCLSGLRWRSVGGGHRTLGLIERCRCPLICCDV